MGSIVLGLVFAAAVGQPPPRNPREYVSFPIPGNAERLLEDLLKSNPDARTTAEAIRQRIEQWAQRPGEFEKELANLQKNPIKIDPVLTKIAEQFLRENPDLAKGQAIDPNALRKFGEQLLGNEELLKRIGEAVPDKIAEPMPEVVPPKVTPKPKERGDKLRARGEDRESMDRWFARRFSEWLQGQEEDGRIAEFFRESPALQEAAADLVRSFHEVEEGWRPNMPKFDLPFELEPPSLPGLGELPNWTMPELPALPRFEFQGPRPPALNLRFNLFGGGVAAPSMPSVSWSTEWLYVVLALILVVGLAWLLRRLPWAERFTRSVSRAWLPMPLDVTTRGELRLAFEALALNRLGDKARPWNHLLVARQLGGPVADDLARLYEQARYTPGEEPLAPADRERARRCLLLLAGGPA
jgi:hypothetical protein